MLHLSQRDEKWASEKLGKSYVTVGRYGCLVTSLSMLSSYYGGYKSPKALAKGLSYTKDGLVIWSSLPKMLPFELDRRLYRRDDKAIKASLKDPDTAVILEVDNYHWVVAIGFYKFAPWVYRIVDPWTGRVTNMAIGPYKRITGSAHLIRK